MTSEESKRFKEAINKLRESPQLSEEQFRIAISTLSSQFKKTAFINIVEEPEQNLFPTSQWSLLEGLLDYNNLSVGNKLIMTSHSPYIISYLTLALKAGSVYGLIEKSGKAELINEIVKIVPRDSVVNPEDLAIYEIDESGKIIKLENYHGLPSDDNYLNQILEQSNILFSQLLDIEDKCL